MPPRRPHGGEADALAARLDRERTSAAPKVGGPVTVSQFLRDTWLPQKRRQVRTTTAYRYAWFVDRYIIPATATSPCGGYGSTTWTLSTRSWRPAAVETVPGPAPKTVLQVHMIIRASLDAAGQRELIERNVASAAHVRLSAVAWNRRS